MKCMTIISNQDVLDLQMAMGQLASLLQDKEISITNRDEINGAYVRINNVLRNRGAL